MSQPTKTKARSHDKRRLPLHEERSCGSCDACCTVFSIALQPGETPPSNRWPESGEKPMSERCPHLLAHEASGCDIYESRPHVCRVWNCIWRSGSNLMEKGERPDQIGVILDNPRDKETAHRLLFVREAYPGGLKNPKAVETLIRLSKQRVIAVVDGANNVVFTMGDDAEARVLGVRT